MSENKAVNARLTVSSLDNASSAPAIVEKFVIRLPKGLREQIKEVSEHNRRSMNAEIVKVLEQYIQQQKTVAHENPVRADSLIADVSPTREEELNRRLESLPEEKKNALLSLLA